MVKGLDSVYATFCLRVLSRETQILVRAFLDRSVVKKGRHGAIKFSRNTRVTYLPPEGSTLRRTSLTKKIGYINFFEIIENFFKIDCHSFFKLLFAEVPYL